MNIRTEIRQCEMCIELTSGMAWMSQWALSQHSVDTSEVRLQRTRFQLNFQWFWN